jgi:prevent-host-death family protein
MAILIDMDVSVAEAKNRLSELIRAVEDGEPVVITRKGRPVAQLMPAPPQRRPIRFGSMRNLIRLNAGWNDPVNLDKFLAGEL